MSSAEKTYKSYLLPGSFLGLMLVMFLAGTWMLYERLRLGHQAEFEAAVNALPPFDEEAASKEIAKECGFEWPLQGPKSALEAVAKRVEHVLAEPPEGEPKLAKPELEEKLCKAAGYAKDETGAWRTHEFIVKSKIDLKRKAFDLKRAQEVEELKKANSRNGFFRLDPPKEEFK